MISKLRMKQNPANAIKIQDNQKSRVRSTFSCTDLAKVFHTGLSYKYYSLAYYADNGASVITLDISSI